MLSFARKRTWMALRQGHMGMMIEEADFGEYPIMPS